MKNMLLASCWLLAIFFIIPDFGYSQEEKKAQKFVIGGVSYIACQPSETVVAPFNTTAGGVTTNLYSGFILLKVCGTGQSAGTSLNDAFYFDIPGNPTHDPNFFQLVTTIGSSVFEGPVNPNTAYRHIVYDVDAGTAVTPPYLPPFRTNNTYTFIINMNTLVPAPVGPSILRFGVSDGVVNDNSGAYTVQVTQLCESCKPNGIPQLTEEWVKRFNGSANSTDGARSLAVDKDGNVYITGSTTSTGTGLDYITIKYNAAGKLQWKAQYNGTANDEDEAFSIAVDSKGNAYVTGRSTGDGTGLDFVTIKYNSAGVKQWSARYNGPGNGRDFAKSIAVDDKGNVYVTGESIGDGTLEDFATIKYNKDGKKQWVARYDGFGRNDAANALALDEDGNVYVTGGSPAGVDTDEEDSDYTTIKYNKNGKELWVKRYDGPVAGNFSDQALAIAVDKWKNVYVTGGSANSSSEEALDYATVKYDANGNEKWAARYDGPGKSDDLALSIAVDASQNVYVTGQSAAEPQETNFDYATIKYNANGQEVWVRSYNGPANDDDQANSLALDNKGNVYVTGRSIGTGTGYDFATIKYNMAGDEQSVARYNGPGNDNDGPAILIGFFTSHPLAVDKKGNVYVTGLSTGIGSGFDITTIKYSQQPCEPSSGTITGRIGQFAAGSTTMPAKFKVAAAPNPAATTTKIFYELPAEGRVSIQVFDVLGRKVTTLVDATKQAGFHNTDFNVTTLQKGIYIYRITVKSAKTSWSEAGKISVVK